jgi:hypothetical protein
MRALSMTSALAAMGLLSTAPAWAQYLPSFTAGNAVVGSPAVGNDLVRVWLQGVPDVVCNDGTTPALYVRRAQNPADRDNWVIYLEGGGNCGTGDECLKRWTGVDSNYGIQQMSTSVPQAVWNAWHPAAPPPQGWTAQFPDYAIPPTIGGTGIFDPVNSPFRDWNRVYANYCSSDNWTGQQTDSLLALSQPVSGFPSYRVHFRGAAIFDEMVARLRAGLTYCPAGPCESLPSLDSASVVLLSGSSAGSSGVKQNLDRFRETMLLANPAMDVRGVLDAGGAPPTAALPWPASGPITSYTQYVGGRWTEAYQQAWNARVDASCLAENAPANQFLCGDSSHVLRHHVTSPFFLRMDLQDENGLDPYQELFYPAPPYPALLAEARFATDVSAHLRALDHLATNLLPRYPGELARVAADPQWLHPALFGPRCTNHVGITGGVTFFQQQLVDPAGVPTSFAEALWAWVNTVPAGLAGPLGQALIAPAGVGPMPPVLFCP